MARGVKQIGPFTQAEKAQFSTFEEAFVPGWDRRASGEQKMVRNRERSRLGQKKTPIGAGRLKPRI